MVMFQLNTEERFGDGGGIIAPQVRKAKIRTLERPLALIGCQQRARCCTRERGRLRVTPTAIFWILVNGPQQKKETCRISRCSNPDVILSWSSQGGFAVTLSTAQSDKIANEILFHCRGHQPSQHHVCQDALMQRVPGVPQKCPSLLHLLFSVLLQSKQHM